MWPRPFHHLVSRSRFMLQFILIPKCFTFSLFSIINHLNWYLKTVFLVDSGTILESNVNYPVSFLSVYFSISRNEFWIRLCNRSWMQGYRSIAHTSQRLWLRKCWWVQIKHYWHHFCSSLFDELVKNPVQLVSPLVFVHRVFSKVVPTFPSTQS